MTGRERCVGGDDPIALLFVLRQVRHGQRGIECLCCLACAPLGLQRGGAQNTQRSMVGNRQSIIGHLLGTRVLLTFEQQAQQLQAVCKHVGHLLQSLLGTLDGLYQIAAATRLARLVEITPGTALLQALVQCSPRGISLQIRLLLDLHHGGCRLDIVTILQQQVNQQALVLHVIWRLLRRSPRMLKGHPGLTPVDRCISRGGGCIARDGRCGLLHQTGSMPLSRRRCRALSRAPRCRTRRNRRTRYINRLCRRRRLRCSRWGCLGDWSSRRGLGGRRERRHWRDRPLQTAQGFDQAPIPGVALDLRFQQCLGLLRLAIAAVSGRQMECDDRTLGRQSMGLLQLRNGPPPIASRHRLEGFVETRMELKTLERRDLRTQLHNL